MYATVNGTRYAGCSVLVLMRAVNSAGFWLVFLGHCKSSDLCQTLHLSGLELRSHPPVPCGGVQVSLNCKLQFVSLFVSCVHLLVWHFKEVVHLPNTVVSCTQLREIQQFF